MCVQGRDSGPAPPWTLGGVPALQALQHPVSKALAKSPSYHMVGPPIMQLSPSSAEDSWGLRW